MESTIAGLRKETANILLSKDKSFVSSLEERMDVERARHLKEIRRLEGKHFEEMEGERKKVRKLVDAISEAYRVREEGGGRGLNPIISKVEEDEVSSDRRKESIVERRAREQQKRHRGNASGGTSGSDDNDDNEKEYFPVHYGDRFNRRNSQKGFVSSVRVGSGGGFR